ncbi:MAG: hypothetical protein E6G15_00505 [Actinobacteria bacterium]|nr:MAG: hypothetical protein E6G15_00505 [Actinomycetota bacterium]
MDLPKLRTSGRAGAKQAADQAALPASFPVNELAELVADLIESTGLVSPDRLAPARSRAKQGSSFASAVLDEGIATPEGIARTLASRFHLPFVDLPLVGVNQDAVEKLPLHVLERVNAIPYAVDDNVLRIAVGDPGNVQAIDELRLGTSLQLELAVASREDIASEIKRLTRASEAFGARAVIEEEAALLGEEEEELDDLEVDDGISDVPLVRLVNSIIFQAAEDGASDVHFVPQEDTLAVRLRIDGVLHEVQRIPKRMMPGVTTRLKVLAKLDIAERRKPQDGRISLNAAAAGRLLDIRVATLPTVEGESVVMRLLDKSKKAPTLTDLGLNEMGVEPFLTGSAVSAVLAQRLARKLCTHCCEMYSPTTEDLIKARVSPDVAAAADGVVFYRKKGCPRCGQTGYKGRVGVYQLLVMSENLESLAAAKASREELERAAIEEGMRTLWDDGLAKVAAGLTSIEELARVTT